jgi:hypothetical protein
MTCTITYRKADAEHRLEWIVPTGWSAEAIRLAFLAQYPQAQILTLRVH